MKKIVMLGAVILFSAPFLASADTLTCPEGQVVQTVEVTPAVVGTPAVTHIVHHDAVTHQITVTDTAAFDEYVFVGQHNGDYLKLGNGNYVALPNHLGSYNKVHHNAVTHQQTVIDTPAFDEVVVDVPAVIATPAVTADQCVDAPVVPVVVVPVVSSAPAELVLGSGGGHRRCGTLQTPDCATWVQKLNAEIRAWLASR